MISEKLKNLFDEKIRFNCSYYEMKRNDKSDLLIIFLGTSEYLITTNYHGVVAYGTRKYDYDSNNAIYDYEIINNNIRKSDIEKLIKTYEAKRLKIKSVIFKE